MLPCCNFKMGKGQVGLLEQDGSAGSKLPLP